MNFRRAASRFEITGKKILSIDYGTKVVGLATYSEGVDPFPTGFEKLKWNGDENLAKQLQIIVKDESIDIVVLGLPLLLDGTESDTTTLVKRFAILLDRILKNIEIILQDETLTTYEAKDRMKNSPEYNFKIDPLKIDVLSAVIILEDFLKGLNK